MQEPANYQPTIYWMERMNICQHGGHISPSLQSQLPCSIAIDRLAFWRTFDLCTDLDETFRREGADEADAPADKKCAQNTTATRDLCIYVTGSQHRSRETVKFEIIRKKTKETYKTLFDPGNVLYKSGNFIRHHLLKITSVKCCPFRS
jgi:hypothetical protein